MSHPLVRLPWIIKATVLACLALVACWSAVEADAMTKGWRFALCAFAIVCGALFLAILISE
jgi:hypothetical protein